MNKSSNVTDKNVNYNDSDDDKSIIGNDGDEDAFVNLDDPNIEVLDDDEDDEDIDIEHDGNEEERTEQGEENSEATVHHTQKLANVCKRTREQLHKQQQEQLQEEEEEQERCKQQRQHHEALLPEELEEHVDEASSAEDREDDEANVSMSNHSESDVENLNEMSDVEPERDDAMCQFTAPEHKPIHTITSFTYSANNMTLVAAAGEGEEVYVLRYETIHHTNGSTDNKDNKNDIHMDSTNIENNARCNLELVQTLRGHTDTISQLQFSPNGEWLASAGLDSSIMLWHVDTSCRSTPCQHTNTLTDVQGEILSLLWHPSSLILVASSECAQSGMWNVVKGTLLMYFTAHLSAINVVAWSPDYKKLLMACADGSVAQYSPKTGAQEWHLASSQLSSDNAAVTALCNVSVDQCVAGCEDGTLHVISLRHGKVVTHLDEVHEQAIESLKVNNLQTLLISTSCDCHVVIWEVHHFSPRLHIIVGESVIPALWLSSFVFVVGCSDGALRS